MILEAIFLADKLIDRKKLKGNVKKFLDEEVFIDDYRIKLDAIMDDNGNLEKYKIELINEETEQIVGFVLEYDVDAGYSRELFEEDLYKKIALSLKKMIEMHAYNCIRNGRYAALNKGDRFGFGNYKGMPIRWRVLDKKDNKIMVISDEIICKRKFHHNTSTNKWSECDLRKWLNEEFYNKSFDAGEKELIDNTIVSTTGCEDTMDRIFLLSKEEVDSMFGNNNSYIRASSWWWLRSPGGNDSNAGVVLAGSSSEGINSNVDNSEGAVCPVFWLKY